MPKITPCLWFDTEGEDAARFYTSVFPNSRIVDVARYGEAGPRDAGTVMAVRFELDGQELVALNGGPEFTFDEAISFQIDCGDQDEVDRYWEELSAGGEQGPCGWLKDRFGLSWQVVPRRLLELLGDPDQEKAQRVMAAMLQMRKLEIGPLEEAAASSGVPTAETDPSNEGWHLAAEAERTCASAPALGGGSDGCGTARAPRVRDRRRAALALQRASPRGVRHRGRGRARASHRDRPALGREPRAAGLPERDRDPDRAVGIPHDASALP